MTSEDGFGTVAIIGVGLIGGSLGMALKRRGLCSRVIGIGRDTGRLDKAVAYAAIDTYSLDVAEGVADADIIVMCTPVARIIDELPTVLRSAKSSAVVTDVGSVKSAIVGAASGDPRFVGSHPMAGSESTGVDAARATLFQDATWAVTPIATTAPDAVNTAIALGKAVGSSVHTLTPEAHDRAVAITSHLPHVIATSVMLVAASAALENPLMPALSAGSFADLTRVAASSPELWRDICTSNRHAVLAAIDLVERQLGDARALIASDDPEALFRLFADGAEAKGRWRRD